MRLLGICTECGRSRLVRVSSGSLWKIQIGKVEGLCWDCEMKS